MRDDALQDAIRPYLVSTMGTVVIPHEMAVRITNALQAVPGYAQYLLEGVGWPTSFRDEHGCVRVTTDALARAQYALSQVPGVRPPARSPESALAELWRLEADQLEAYLAGRLENIRDAPAAVVTNDRSRIETRMHVLREKAHELDNLERTK